ncbi:hypothetical protein GOP47_0027501 [Adiantum capillus-veneris]|nr:hypothetical protein GOP47_0027501 [Adiantum capillus-veneris]
MFEIDRKKLNFKPSAMANKLGINKPRPADLSSLSVYPSLYDRSNNLRRYCNSQRDQANRQPQSQQSVLYSASSQSQQSFSQGVTFSQPFSQLSQDDPATAFEEWRCNREGIPFSGKPPARVSETLNPEDSSRKRLPVSKTSSLIKHLNSQPLPETSSHATEEIVKRLEILDEGLSKVITMLDSVQGDVQKLFKAVESASLDSEGIRQKMKQQESSLQLLLKEDEKIRKTLTSSLNKLSEQKSNDSNLTSLFDEIHSIPAALTRHLSLIKTDLLTCIRNELQTVRECVKSRIEGWTSAETLPFTSFNYAEAVFQENKLPSCQKKLSTAVSVPRKRQTRKVALSTKQPCIASTSQTGQRRAPLNRAGCHIIDKGLPTLPPVDSLKRGRQGASKKGGTAVAKQSLNASLATFNIESNFTRKDEDSWTAIKKSTGCKAPKTTPVQHPQHSKRLIMQNAKVESDYMDNFTFEMEEVESPFVPANSKNVSKGLDEFLVEDEVQAIRKKMMKARQKRQRSTCVSLGD